MDGAKPRVARKARLLDPPRAVFENGVSDLLPYLIYLGTESEASLV